MQVAAMRPQYLTRDEVPADVVENERRIAEATAKEEGKPERYQAVPLDTAYVVNGPTDTMANKDRLWRQIRALGWHAVMRVRPDATFAPQGLPRRPAKTLVPGPGHAWVGAGTLPTICGLSIGHIS